MDFFQHQDRARRNSVFLLVSFLLTVVCIVAAVYFAFAGILSYLSQNDREIPSGLVLPLCCYPIALFRVAGLEEIARNLTKTQLTGLDGLAPLAMSLISSQYGEKGLLKNSEALISTASDAVSTIDISVFDF